MLIRDLFFVGLLGTGVVALGVRLFPPSIPPRKSTFDVQHVQSSESQDVVRKLNSSLAQEWSRLNLQPAKRAADLVIVRRLALALTGTIPSLQEIRQFEAYSGEERLSWWLSGVFADRRYADYFAERLARSYVGTEDGPFILYRRHRFVSWLGDELAKNRPYDEIVRNLITAHGLWTDKPATNFTTVTLDQGNKNEPNPERLAGRVTRAFLGVRLDCAQCHNHPFEKWKQTDFHGLAAFFGQVHQGLTGIYDGEGDYKMENRKTGNREPIGPAVPFLAHLLPAEGTLRERLATWVTHPQNPYFAQAIVNRVWALMLGRPLVDPVDNIPTNIELPAALKLLSADFAVHGYDLQRLIQIITATDAFQLDSAAEHEITDAHESAWAAFPMSRLRPEQVAGSLTQMASLQTNDQRSALISRLVKFGTENDFIKRYGDTGEDEFDGRGGTIPQCLLLMNGDMVADKTRDNIVANAASRIALLAPDDAKAVETAFLAVLTRRPTAEQSDYFCNRLAENSDVRRTDRMEDLFWALINSTGFSWNH